MNNQILKESGGLASIYQERKKRDYRRKTLPPDKDVHHFEIRPSKDWRILKIGLLTKRASIPDTVIRKRKKMPTQEEYLQYIREIELEKEKQLAGHRKNVQQKLGTREENTRISKEEEYLQYLREIKFEKETQLVAHRKNLQRKLRTQEEITRSLKEEEYLQYIRDLELEKEKQLVAHRKNLQQQMRTQEETTRISKEEEYLQYLREIKLEKQKQLVAHRKNLQQQMRTQEETTRRSKGEKYLQYLREIELEKEKQLVAQQQMRTQEETSRNSKEPIIIIDLDYSSESNEKHKTNTQASLNSNSYWDWGKRFSGYHKHPDEQTSIYQVQENNSRNIKPGEKSSPKYDQISSSSESPHDNQNSAVNKSLSYRDPRTHETGIEYPSELSEVSAGQTIGPQFMSNSSQLPNQYRELRNLLQKPITSVKKGFLQKHYKQQMIDRLTSDVQATNVNFENNTNKGPSASNPSTLETQHYHSNASHEQQTSTSFENNPPYPEKQLTTSSGFSGGYGIDLRTQPHHIANNTNKLVLNSSNIASQSDQLVPQKNVREYSRRRSYSKRRVANSNHPRVNRHGITNNTPHARKHLPNSSHQMYQFKTSSSKNQITSAPKCCPCQDHQSQKVNERMTKGNYALKETYSQNKESNPTLAIQPSCSFVHNKTYYTTARGDNYCQHSQVEENLGESNEDPRILYWANVGLQMYYDSLVKSTLPQLVDMVNYQHQPIENSVVNQHLSLDFAPDPNKQASKEIPAAKPIEQVCTHNIPLEGIADNVSLVQDSQDLYNQPSAIDENLTEQQISTININDSDNASRRLELPLEISNEMEQNSSSDTNGPATDQTSQNEVIESHISTAATEEAFLRQLNSLFIEMDLKTNAIHNELRQTWFKNSETIEKVMISVQDYCASEIRNDCVSLLQGGTADIQNITGENINVQENQDRHSFDDNNNDENVNDDSDKYENYKLHNNEYDDEPYEKSRRKRTKTSYILPPEFDATDTRWTLKHKESGPGLVELLPHSNIFVNAIQLANCKRMSKDTKTLARMLLLEVFSYNALAVCSLTGGRHMAYYVEGISRPGLDQHAKVVLMTYVERFSSEKRWCKVGVQSLLNSIRWKLKDIRDKVRV